MLDRFRYKNELSTDITGVCKSLELIVKDLISASAF